MTPREIRIELQRQIACLVATELYLLLGMTKLEYITQLSVLVRKFRWSNKLSALGLKDVAIFDYRLGKLNIAKAGKVRLGKEVLGRANRYGDVVIAQVDWGDLHRNEGAFPELPQDLVPFSDVEGLHAFVYWPIAHEHYWVDSRSPKAPNCCLFWCSRTMHSEYRVPACLSTGVFDSDDPAEITYGAWSTDPDPNKGVPIRSRTAISLQKINKQSRRRTRRSASSTLIS